MPMVVIVVECWKKQKNRVSSRKSSSLLLLETQSDEDAPEATPSTRTVIPKMSRDHHSLLHLLTTGIPRPRALRLGLARAPRRASRRAGSLMLHHLRRGAASGTGDGGSRSGRGRRRSSLARPEHDWKDGIEDEEEGLMEERTEGDGKPSSRFEREVFEVESGCCTEDRHH